MRSIRRQLLMGVAAVQVGATLLATLLVVHQERRQSYAMLDSQLVERAATVTSLIEPPDDPTAKAILHRELLTLPRRDVYVLSDSSGNLIAASGEWRPTDASPPGQRSFSDSIVRGRRYRVLSERGIAMFDDNPQEMARLPKLMLIYGAPAGGVEEHLQRVAWGTAGLGLAILGLSLLATGWVVRSGLMPLTRLAANAAEIDSTRWKWEPGNGATATEELASLSTALTLLVERLRAAFARERQFSADAAHEMKTAVAIVKSTLQLALEREDNMAEQRKGLERALEDTERMQRLVSAMLQLAKIEGLGSPARGNEVTADAVEQIHSTIDGLAPLLEARQLRAHVEASEAMIFVRISPAELALVLTNLVENSIQYSQRGGVIEVRAETQGPACIVRVRDGGCGIEPEALPHIFKRFYRGDASRSRESGGAGLGLAIVQAIVQRAGGSIEVASSSGTGSEFTITLHCA